MYARRILAHGFDSQRMPKAYDVVRFKPKTAKQWLLENKESEAITRQEEIFLLAPNPRSCPNTDTAFQRKEPKGFFPLFNCKLKCLAVGMRG